MKPCITEKNCKLIGGEIIDGHCIYFLPRNPVDIEVDFGIVIDENGKKIKEDL